MQNTKQALSVVGTAENKRPNILRRKTNDKNKLPTSLIDNPHSLLIPSELINGGITLNTYEGGLNSSYCPLLPEVFDTRFEDELSHGVFNTQQTNNSKKVEKIIPRRRRPSQKIILDTYICDKSRIAKQSIAEEENEPKYTLLKNVEPFVPLETNILLQDVSTFEGTCVETNAEENVSTVIAPVSVESVVRDLQENNILIHENVLTPTQFVPVDVNLESENVPHTFRENESSEGQMLLLSEDQLESRQMWLCPLATCNTLFSDKGMLDSHMASSHFDLKTFMCNIDKCNKAYTNEENLKQHQETYHKNTGVQNECTKPSGETWEEVKRRTRNLVNEALMSVGVTEETMQSIVLPDGSRCWPCTQSECNLAFQTQYMLKNHILAHHDLRPFKCTHPNCGWAFRSLAKLRVHSESHSGVRRHVCSEPGCCRTFSTKSNLNLHMNKVHGEGTGGFPCPSSGCEEIFPDKVQLKDHITCLHADNKCDVCGKKFWHTSRLVAHSRTHVHAELQCAWPGCGKVFSQPSRLRYHQRSHTGDKPYRCTHPSCFWAFTSASKLRRHARAHAGDKGRKYSCSICSRSFMRAEHLREHHIRHLPNRQYMCDHPGCEEAFSNKSSVYVHKKRDHAAASEVKLRNNRKTGSNKILVSTEEVQTSPVMEEPDVCTEEVLSLRSARTHVPWKGCHRMLTGENIQDITNQTTMQDDCSMLQHHAGIEEKQGNPLVCGGLELEGGEEMVGGSSVGAELCLGGDVSQQGVDLNINSLLMQEELSEGMLYTRMEDDSPLHVLLLNEEPAP